METNNPSQSNSSITTSPDLFDNLMRDIDDDVPSVIVDPVDPNDFSVCDEYVDEYDPELAFIQQPSGSSGGDNERLSCFMVTLWPDNQDPKWLRPSTYGFLEENLQRWGGQYEKAPLTDTLHAHLLVQFRHPTKMSRKNIRKYFNARLQSKNCNIVPVAYSKANIQRVVNYVLKPDTRIDGTSFALEPSEHIKHMAFDQGVWNQRKPKVPKSEAKWQKQVDWILSKPAHWTWSMIVHESYESQLLLGNCSAGRAFHNDRMSNQPRRNIQECVLLYGAGGTGKTTFARNIGTDDDGPLDHRVYLRNFLEEFWGSGSTAYNGQPWLHLEEFNGQEAFGFLKQIADTSDGAVGPAVKTKGSGTHLNHRGIVITSNYHPATWYRGVWKSDPKQWWPFARRITKVLFFPEFKEDGTLNQPGQDGQTDLYFVDQTDEFRTFSHDYTEAMAHCNRHWPAKEEPDEEGDRWNPPTRGQVTGENRTYGQTAEFLARN
uniref:Putative replication related protein n=1 Tax=Thalassionema nitzschioides DNA virus TaxID=1290582 RepID=S6BVP6_9VIRU|nr:putative replication related protein [Thalassionema nitzschioides DNA virus]